MKVTVHDKYWECDYVFLEVIRVERYERTFRIVKKDGFYKEYDNKRFSYIEEE